MTRTRFSRPLHLFLFLLVCQASIPFLTPVIHDFHGVEPFIISRRHPPGNNITGVESFSSTSAARIATRSIPRKKFLPSLVDAPYHSLDYVRPAFSDIVQDHRNHVIIGDLQFLLDFAIIGHVKCGTSTMMKMVGTTSSSTLSRT